MAVIVFWQCTAQRVKAVTDYNRDESYFVPTEPPCENQRSVRFDLQYTVYRGKRGDGDWSKWCVGRDDAYSELEYVCDEITQLWNASDHPHVVECDVGHTPDGVHGRIVLEAETEHGYIKAVYEVQDE